MRVSVEGAEKVMRNLAKYRNKLVRGIADAIWFEGNQVTERIRIKFPDLQIKTIFNQSLLEFAIVIEVEGAEMTWLWCEKWHRFFRRKKGDETATGQEMRSNVPRLENEIKKEVDLIFNNLVVKLNQIIVYRKG